MGTFLILIALVTFAMIVIAVVLGAGGIVIAVVFGDVLIAGLIIFWIVRAITRKKK